MNIIERIRKSNVPAWKLVLGALLIVLAILLGVKILAKTLRYALYGGSYGKPGIVMMGGGTSSGIAMPSPAMPPVMQGYGGGMMADVDGYYGEKGIAVSESRVASGGYGYAYNYAVGSDAEEYETTQYFGHYETARLDRVCSTIEGLKSRPYVVFLNASKDEYRCSYTFKVENARATEIKEALESLNPKTFSANTETLKPVLDEFISEKEILQKKLDSIEDMLTDASRSFDEIRDIAAEARDIETLGQIINNHLMLIERLTNERLATKAQFDRISKMESAQTDRLVYTQFSINVDKKEVFDFRSIADSWFEALQRFVRNVNAFAQIISIGLVSLILYLIPLLLYAFVALVVVKYGWRFARKFWKQ